MFTLTALLRQQTPAAADCGVGVLEGALARNWRALRFEPALERAFERDTGMARAWRHIVCNLLGVASFWLLSGTDLARLEASGAPLAALRMLVSAVSLAVVALLWGLCRSGHGQLREALTTLGTLALAGYAIVASHYLADAQALMQGSGLLLIFLHVGVAARLQFRFAVTVNLATWLGYAVFSRSGPHTAEILHNHLLLFGVVVLFSTVGNFLLEYRERRNYLLESLQAQRHIALLADAEALRELTLRDGLTGLFNRRHLDAEMGRLCTPGRGGAAPVGLLHVDVDHFKRYNDRHGHPAGDRCLIELSAALAAVAERHGGLAARIGGEEFAVLLPGQDADRAAAVAAEVCDAVRARRLAHDDSPVGRHVSVSVGAAASVPGRGVWASTLVGAADAALYAAKRAGRDRCARFDASLTAPASPRVRPSIDSMPPGIQAPADEIAAINRLSGLLGHSVGWLRFPADIECEFQERGASERHRQLAFLVTAGLAMTLVYVALCRPVLPDIADMMLRDLLSLSIGAIGLTAFNLKMAFGWRVREGIVAAVISVFGLAIVWIESLSQAPTVYSATLGLCLLPMFSSLVAAQPLRFSLVPSLLICIAIATVMAPDDPERREGWLTMLGVVCSATLYSLIGGYLLELAHRRAYLLDRLRLAQLAVLRQNTEHLQQLATVDPLTRLPNRRHFEAELERLASACSSAAEPLGLLIIDIDHFKRFNDGYGHPAGDACLQRVGAALSKWTRTEAPQRPAGNASVPARIGGEEFGVLLPGCDASAALAAAQRLRLLLHALRIEHAHSPVGRFVSVSIGAASLVLERAADARLLLQAADAALYRAKAMGRDQATA